MSGKPYTMREMKGIVEYLVDHKAYTEVRGRKMWMDFANSQLTTRTWQSLKETFLKRILPDLHNPYYKLNIMQIQSFKQGKDIESSINNKLEVHTVSEDSSSNVEAENKKTGKEQDAPTNKEDRPAGEGTTNITPSRRSSADTLVLDENFYHNAEEIQDILENDKDDTPTKHVKDNIKFEESEYLPSEAKRVLEDFATDSEHSEKASVAEVTEANETIEIDNSEKSHNLTEVEQEVIIENIEELNDDSGTEHLSEIEQFIHNPDVFEADQISDTDTSENRRVTDPKTNEQQTENRQTNETDKQAESVTAITISDSVEIPAGQPEPTHNDQTVQVSNQTQRTSSMSADTLLPNNPEGLNGDVKKKQNDSTEKASNNEKEDNCDKSSNNKDKSKEPVHTNEKHKTEPNNTVKSNSKKRTHSEDSKSSKGSKKSKKTKLNTEKPTEVPKNSENDKNIPTEKQNNIESNKEKANTNVSQKSNKISPENVNNDQKVSEVTQDIEMVNPIQNSNNQNEKVHEIDRNNEIKNPCLQSVSLFEEEFNAIRFSSDSSCEINTNEVQNMTKCPSIKNMLDQEVVVLKSNSESEQDKVSQRAKKVVTNKSKQKEREKALANVFGFTGVPASRKRRISSKRMPQRLSCNLHSESSEWTSETDSEEYISPPRGRKNRHARRYLKPKSTRVLSLEEEGGLFVMHGNRIYPLVKDGKVIKNYLSFSPGSDSEEEQDSYWKQKYVEQKLRNSELKKKLQTKGREKSCSNTESKSSSGNNNIETMRRTLGPKEQEIEHKNVVLSDDNSTKETKQQVQESNENTVKTDRKEEKIKITFAKNNQEVHLEGHWLQIHPVIKEVVEIFQREPEVVESGKTSRGSDNKNTEIEQVVIHSGRTTPFITTVDPVIHAKVNEIEKEIFKTIEDIEKQEQVNPQDNGVNVTKRRGRPRKSSSAKSAPPSPAKSISKPSRRSIATVNNAKDNTSNDANGKTSDIEQRSSKRLRSLTPKKKDSVEAPATKAKTTRGSNIKVKPIELNNDEDLIRYKLPPQQANTKTKNTTGRRSLLLKNGQETPFFSDSTLGYQDSDYFPLSVTKRKRRFSLRTKQRKPKRSLRSLPGLSHAYSPDSSNSSYFVPMKNSQSTLNSEVYRTESYQLLMPAKTKTTKTSLQSIQENAEEFRHFDRVAQDKSSLNINVEIASSSNISLPLSPELSVVENLTLSREAIRNESVTMEEIQRADNGNIAYNNYILSDIDVSAPLMDQDCDLVKNVKDSTSKTLLNKIESVNLKEKSISDSLDTKLRDLLLESAKKISNNADNIMEVDKGNATQEAEIVAKKSRNNKRCSTPRKRKTTTSIKVPDKSVIVEERMECCSFSGRLSCPPAITINEPEKTGNNCDDVTVNTKVARKKKDIIRVKIQRPKSRTREKSVEKSGTTKKSVSRENSSERHVSRQTSTDKRVSKEKLPKKSNKNATRTSICTDSGINNDSELSELLKVTDDSVELIHNHSETCLLANECIGDSVQFVENSKSIVSINTTGSIDNELLALMNDVETTGDVYCGNAQDISTFEQRLHEDVNSVPGTINHSPANSSLITEDLSNGTPTKPTNWYLFSEEDTTHNIQETQQTKFGSNLQHIFPVTCAVPDLSTISEMSKENDDSRKPNLNSDGDTRNSDSQSLF